MARDEGEELDEFVKNHEDLEFKADQAKVLVKSTGHEMPARLHLVKEYLAGGKYRKAKEMYNLDWTKYEPQIVPHEVHKKFLYCTLTKTTLPMDPKKVELHVNSKRFKTLVEEQEKKKKEQAVKEEEKKALKAKLREKRIAAAKAAGKWVEPKAKAGVKKKIGAKKKAKAKAGKAAKGEVAAEGAEKAEKAGSESSAAAPTSVKDSKKLRRAATKPKKQVKEPQAPTLKGKKVKKKAKGKAEPAPSA
mmetsp:Transcript_84565/g.176902  ORF Transcript_84565/g.176902 Transcript_84565/m.176902 type:complete len:247 (+) Transcript_84565:68-808(+)|eukprot:CAMPEP_0206481948 /NCGR_PEP_ID=MMETSP0324_2-20121206/38513_1 /ASSEMBLY_ACC=CAM_ASM_000836 /TAXON_ID=2866 /ORGANISM="Crypthecodinium cohnii, Strain Seligo" /LENGTH=246 /DNA_ID=CAMNT_0053959663 /DNA_START=40 /DNA_END=780 /DNA_ORIENTATION=-